MDETLGIISNILSILSGIVIVLMALRKDEREDKDSDVSAVEIFSDAAVGLVEPLQTRVAELEGLLEDVTAERNTFRKRTETLTRITEARSNMLAMEKIRVSILEGLVGRLQAQVRELGGTPATYGNGENYENGGN